MIESIRKSFHSIYRIIELQLKFSLRAKLNSKEEHSFTRNRESKKCFVLLAADYGNLGDVAITYAQEKWLRERLPDYEIVDVPISKTLSSLKTIQRVCTIDDIITLVGGGNMSDLYFDIELLRQMVVKAFPNNRIISFPQTMFFSDTIGGRYLKRRGQKIYSHHKFLTLGAREQKSYELMQSMKLKSVLVPDIVMTLNKRKLNAERNGITLCFRQDAESKLSDQFKDELTSLLKKDFKVFHSDTHIGDCRLELSKREQELNNIWEQFCSSEWVVTDRLHGMIFAFITATPCVVLPNNNYKIEGCYRWIEDCGFIHFMNDLNISRIIDIIYTHQSCYFENTSKRLRLEVEKLLKA